MSAKLRLGLIGDNITRSKSPMLHRLAGEITGLDVSYDRLIPADRGQSFDEVFDWAAAEGYRGINITYPYKERVCAHVAVPDPLVRAIGAVNTVVFNSDGPEGHNTDYTGFVAAYRAARGAQSTGTVCLIGTGGVGKAVAFGLLALHAPVIRLVDLDAGKAEALAAGLRAAGSESRIEIFTEAAEAARGADGVINCTPIGMVGLDGTPLPAAYMSGASWAFDAVYTPVDTVFLTDAGKAGLQVISGYELFFNQGIDAWHIFTGAPVDAQTLRRNLACS
ncbi:MAG: shikimate dehydrogenase family protein [Paracoccaceae bacterium]